MLTPDQKTHYEVFGYLVLRNVFSDDEIVMMGKAADDALDEARHGENFDGKKSQTVMPFFERRDSTRPLLEDDRIYETVADLLGPEFMLVLTEAHYSVGDTQWHGDHRTRGILPNVKMGIYLEPVNRDNGCLRVMPGSHRSPFFESLSSILLPERPMRPEDYPLRPFGVSGADLPCVDLDSQPGDLVLFTEEVFHAAFGGRSGRPRLALNFEAMPNNAQRIACIREEYAKTKFLYRPTQSLLKSSSPRLRGMVAPLREQLGFDVIDV